MVATLRRSKSGFATSRLSSVFALAHILRSRLTIGFLLSLSPTPFTLTLRLNHSHLYGHRATIFGGLINPQWLTIRVGHTERLTMRCSEPRTVLMPRFVSMRTSSLALAVADLES